MPLIRTAAKVDGNQPAIVYHLLLLSFFPVNELLNLLPIDRALNQRTTRARLPSAARPGLVTSYNTYGQSAALGKALQQDATLRFGSLVGGYFAAQLAARAVVFIDDVATVRLAGRRF